MKHFSVMILLYLICVIMWAFPAEALTQEEAFEQMELRYGNLSPEWTADQLNDCAQFLRESQWEEGQRDGLSAIALYSYAPILEEYEQYALDARSAFLSLHPEISKESPWMSYFASWVGFSCTRVHMIIFSDDIWCADISMDTLEVLSEHCIDENTSWYAPYVTDDYFTAKRQIQHMWHSDAAPDSFWQQIDAHLDGNPWDVQLVSDWIQYPGFINHKPLVVQAFRTLCEDSLNPYMFSHNEIIITASLPDEHCISEERAIQIARESLTSSMMADPSGELPLELLEHMVYSIEFTSYDGDDIYSVGFETADQSKSVGFVLIDALTGEVLQEYWGFGEAVG